MKAKETILGYIAHKCGSTGCDRIALTDDETEGLCVFASLEELKRFQKIHKEFKNIPAEPLILYDTLESIAVGGVYYWFSLKAYKRLRELIPQFNQEYGSCLPIPPERQKSDGPWHGCILSTNLNGLLGRAKAHGVDYDLGEIVMNQRDPISNN